MKNIINIISLCLMLSLVSCEDYLTQEAQDLVIPKTVVQYKELLQGDGYFKTLQNNIAWINYLTDDIATGDPQYAKDPSKISTYIDKYKQVYLWQPEIENDLFKDDLYAYLYTQALPGTICLEKINSMEGSDSERRVLQGQAAFQRALAYFYIANIYGPAYNESKPEDLSVPMSLTATATPGSYPRKTIADVWGQIKADSELAVECLKECNAGVYEINYKAALLLASRVALFMEDYDKAIKYGENLLKIAPKLFDMVNKIDIDKYHLTSKHSDITSVPGILNTNINPDEVLWTFSSGRCPSINYLISGLTMTSMTYCVSNDLISLYDREKDVRLAFFFTDPNPNSFWVTAGGYMAIAYMYEIAKHYSSPNTTGFLMGFRNAEAYLTLSEAYARKSSPDKGKSLYYLNELLKTRILKFTPYTEGDFASGKDLIECIWKERRKELCFEEAHRWWDMRRCGQKGFTKVWMTGDKYIIADKDPSFTLNFPQKERDFDSGLIWNKRPIRTASN